jgi:hypothetical protein
MKKKNNKLVSYFFSIIAIGGLIIGIIYSEKLTFIPDISFCASNPIILCDIPLLGRIVRILDTKFIAAIVIYVGITLSTYFILRFLGFNVIDIDGEEK